MVLEGNIVNVLKNELSVTTENTAVLCKSVANSDKGTNMLTDYWAKSVQFQEQVASKMIYIPSEEGDSQNPGENLDTLSMMLVDM